MVLAASLEYSQGKTVPVGIAALQRNSMCVLKFAGDRT